MSNTEEEQVEERTYTARCLCGKCSLTVTGKPKYYVNCNCSYCRFQTGAAFSAWTGYPISKFGGPDLVGTNSENISEFSATKNGVRSFCKTCGTTWMYHSNSMEFGSIPAALFTKGACHGEENSEIPFGDPPMYFNLESKCIAATLPFPEAVDKKKAEE